MVGRDEGTPGEAMNYLPHGDIVVGSRFKRGKDGKSQPAGDIREPHDLFGYPATIAPGWQLWVEKTRVALIWTGGGLGVMVRNFDRRLWEDDAEIVQNFAAAQVTIEALSWLLRLRDLVV